MLMRAICRTTDLHSVTQGFFDDPCVYLNDTDGMGFDSGLQSGKQFTIRITNDQERRQTSCHFFPLWCVTTSRDSHLDFLQGSGPLRSRNGWVSALSNRYTLSFYMLCIGDVFLS